MRDKRIYASVAGIAALGALLGSFLPWVRFTGPFGEFTKRGLQDEGDGIITLILGLAAVWIVAYYFFGQGTGVVRSLILAGLGAGLIAVAAVDLADTHGRAAGVLQDLEGLAQRSDQEIPTALVAAEGLYMILIGGIAIFLTGLAGTLLPPLNVAVAEQPAEVAAAPPPVVETPSTDD